MKFSEDPASALLPTLLKPLEHTPGMDSPRSNAQLIGFLRKELLLSDTSIAMALRHSEQDPGPLPMILWQYGFVSLEQLEQIFDWLEGQQSAA